MGGGGGRVRAWDLEKRGAPTPMSGGKERFGILQGFLPQGPGEVGKSCTRTWEPTSWRAQSRAKGGRGVMMMGCLYMGEGHH